MNADLTCGDRDKIKRIMSFDGIGDEGIRPIINLSNDESER